MFDSLLSPVDFENAGGSAAQPNNIVPVPPLNDEMAGAAKKELFIKDYPRVDRKFTDPVIPGQKYCLVSFTPSKKATPDSKGMYGMVKVRGVFDNDGDAEEYAEKIIRNTDSLHVIHMCEVGKPFPMIDDGKDYAKETVRIDLQQKMNKDMRKNLKEKKQEELREKREIMERQKKLLAEQKEDAPPDLFDEYTTLHVKRAQLIWTWKELEAKREDVKKALITTRDEIRRFDDESKEYRETYMEKYNAARIDAGIPEDTGEGFVKFMMNDVELPFETE